MKNRYILLRIKILLTMLRKGKLSLRKIFNAIHCIVAYMFKLRSSAKYPFLMNFELWNECNADCMFCRSEKGEIYDQNPAGNGAPIPKGKMPYEAYTAIIDQVQHHLLMDVLYINGEPLMYKELYQAIQYAADRKVATMIATNGTMLTEENIRKLLEAGIDFVKIALSGFTQEKHGIQVRHGDIEKIKASISNFIRINKEGNYGAVLMVDFMRYKYNEDEQPLVRKFCSDLGIMMNVRPGNRKGVEDIEPEQDEGPVPFKVPCDWLWKIISVNWNGDLLPCCDCVVWSGAQAYARFEVGKTDIAQVWNGPEAQKWREIHTTIGRSAIPICSVCRRQGTAFKV